MIRNRRSTAALFAAASIASLACADVVQEQRITPTPRSTSQIFGLGLSFDGASIAVGAGFENSPSLAGAVYVFTRNASGVWTQQARLRGPTPQSADFLGMDLAIEGDTLLVGVPGRDIPGTADAGVVYVYQNVAGAWTLGPTLMPSTPIEGGSFGDTIALSGDLAAIMAWTVAFPDAGGFGPRELYIFERIGGVWQEQARLPAPESYSNGFTASAGVAIDENDTIFVGGSRELHNGNPVGAVATYAKVAGVWQQTGTLRPSDSPAGAHFGQSVAAANGRLVVGAPQDTVNGLIRAGSVYLFENTRGGWTETLKFHAPTPDTRDFFGVHADIENDAMLIGAYQSDLQPFTRDGYACLYHFGPSGLGDPTTITASDGEPHDLFGWRVALNGNRAVVTAIFESLNQGAAYVYSGVGPPCVEDLDGDGAVGLADLALLLSNFGTSGPGLPGDLDGDGDVDLGDLAGLLSAFGTSC